MSDLAGLMHAIHDLPHDDLPRLAFADWLEENGQADRAEFIRVQIALAKLSREDEERFRPLHNREVALITAHKDAWFGTFRSGWSYYDCRRGFIEEVWSSAAAFLPYAATLHERHALQQLRLAGLLPELRKVLRSPVIAFLRSLSFSPDLGSGSTVHDLPTSDEPLEHWPLDLAVTGMQAGTELVRLLTRERLPARLTGLNLSRNLLNGEALAELLDALPSWPRLHRLDLAEVFAPASNIPAGLASSGDECIVQLARHPAIASDWLQEIDLSRNQIGGAGVRALVESPYLGGVRRLILWDRLSRRLRENLRDRFGDRVEGLGGD